MKLLIIIFLLLSLLPTLVLCGLYLWLKFSKWTITFYAKGLTFYVNEEPINKSDEFSHITITNPH